MAKFQFYDFYNKRPPKVSTVLDTDTVFVSQSEVKTSGLAYQLERFGMNTLEARMEQMRSKFGYADCTKNNDFATIQNLYRQSVDYFSALPSDVRRKYQDDPTVFYENIQKNPQTAFEAGFISKEQLDKMLDTTSVDVVKPDVLPNKDEIKDTSDITS